MLIQAACFKVSGCFDSCGGWRTRIPKPKPEQKVGCCFLHPDSTGCQVGSLVSLEGAQSQHVADVCDAVP